MKTKELVLIALMIALSVILSYVKIPSPTGSVALDALPAFALAGVLGPVAGGIVGFFGHLATAANSGFGLGIVLHLVIAVSMFISAYSFGVFYKKGQYVIAVLVGILTNVCLSLPFVAYFIGTSIVIAILPGLIVGAIINVVLGFIVIEPIKKAVNL